jgi:azurin
MVRVVEAVRREHGQQFVGPLYTELGTRVHPGGREDIDAVIADGLRAGPDHAWVDHSDARVIAATQMLSGGEHASVTFPVARLRKGESYTYFCSYPSHALPMRGQLVLGD